MNIRKLIETSQNPGIYSKGTAVMWTDEHISSQLLEIHLHPEMDLASRKESTIALTVAWILANVPGSRLEILDLGCGPGLYTERLAEAGHRVTGMDFSANSIRHARASAMEKRLDIDYVAQDYLTLAEENRFDLIVMIFTDFCVLSPDERGTLLENIHRALKPGGKFIFDVLNDRFPIRESRAWDLCEKGFWKDRPYIALSETFHYEAEKVMLNQHIVIDEAGTVDTYRFWTRIFSHGDLTSLLMAKGFCNIECHDRLLPGGDGYRSEDVTFCIAMKR